MPCILPLHINNSPNGTEEADKWAAISPFFFPRNGLDKTVLPEYDAASERLIGPAPINVLNWVTNSLAGWQVLYLSHANGAGC